MWIDREISGLVKKTSEKRPALLLTGARQTGKSSLLSKLFAEHPYVSLDVPLEAKQTSESYQISPITSRSAGIVDKMCSFKRVIIDTILNC